MTDKPKDWPRSRKQQLKYNESLRLLYGSKVEAEPISAEKTPSPPSQGPLKPFKKVSPTQKTQEPPETPEWREQCAVVSWANMHHALKGLVMKFDNERKRSISQAMVAKRMGLLRGASDLFIARPSGGFHGLFLEMKQSRHYTPSERRSDSWKAQEDFIERTRSVGYAAFMCFGFEHAKATIEKYLDNSLDQNIVTIRS